MRPRDFLLMLLICLVWAFNAIVGPSPLPKR